MAHFILCLLQFCTIFKKPDHLNQKCKCGDSYDCLCIAFFLTLILIYIFFLFMWIHQDLWIPIFIVLVPDWKDFPLLWHHVTFSSFVFTNSSMSPVGNTFLWHVVLLTKKVPDQLCSNILLTYGLPQIVVLSCILYFLYSPKQGYDPFQEYTPSIFKLFFFDFCFLIKYSERHISLFPAALATSTNFWHIVLLLPSFQMFLKVPSRFSF